MSDIDFKIGADLKQFRGAIGNIDHSLKRLSGGFSALGGVIGASFAVDAIRQFVTESVELANQAEGVKVAFDRLNDPQLLSKLKTATAGTVDELKLMQTAVKAKNFRIPMDVLAKGLEFAQRRASETGESVDYMVDSFVTGLGRESVKILDNLGISTIELNKKNKELGSMAAAVGAIMDEEFLKAGDRVQTNSMLIDQQRAEITNLKLAVGEQLQPVYAAFLNEVKGGLNSINTLISDQITGTERMAYIASFFQGAQGKVLRVYLDAQKLARTAVAEHEAAQERLGEETEKTNTSTDGLADTFEKTRNEAFFYTEAIHRLREAHSMLYKAQGAQLQPMVEVTRQLSQAGFDAFTAFDELGNTIGTTLSTSFQAAMISGEDFFKVFAQGLKNMLAQLLAAVAAALVLAVILAALPLGLAGVNLQSIGTAFKHFSGPMMGVPSFGLGGGLGGAMQGGGVQVFGRLSGSDILISSERAGRDRTRLSGITG
jgi:hypothetical protein